MAPASDWKVPPTVQPKPEDYAYDLDEALAAVVGVRSIIPGDAFSAETLGTERAGNGVIIRKDGLILTIGYLITEAETIWLSLSDGRAVAGHVLGYDQETGFGLVQALARLDLPRLSLGQSGGVAVIDQKGDLIGIGSLQLDQPRESGKVEHLNMIVPIDLLKPIFDDLLTYGQRNRPPRPWLGLYATEVDNRVVVVGLSNRGPAKRSDLRTGDVVLAVGGKQVNDLAGLFRRIWSLGNAGVEVPLTIYREGQAMELKVASADRRRFLKSPRLH